MTMGPVQRLEAYHFYEQEWESYKQLRESFEWEIPEQFNVAEYVCDRWADDKGRVALFYEAHDGTTETWTFWQLKRESNRLANYLVEQGIGVGDRIGVNTAPRPEALITHLAAWKMGAVTIPLSILFGPQGLQYRIDDGDAAVCLVDEWNVDNVRDVRPDCDALETLLMAGVPPSGDGEVAFEDALSGRSRNFDVRETDPEDEFLQPYTSGTTGRPKGVVLAHRGLLGHLPHYVATFRNLELADDDVIYTNADWAWVYGLVAVALATLYYGTPLVAHNGGEFDPEVAYELMEEYGVTNVPTTPTTIQMMMDVDGGLDRYDLGDLRLVATGGESVGESVIDWVTDEVGATYHELYGQTELNLLIGDCRKLFEFRKGTMGRASPGHDVAVVDTETAEPTVDPGEIGEIAVRYEDNPVCFKEYWKQPERTAQKKKDNGWAVTGDLATVDEDGYFTFVSRKDDTIISAGYTIGPDEIEDTLSNHDAVLDAGVVGAPDEERGEVPVAFVVLAGGYEPADDLKAELAQYVKDELAKYEYPRDIHFLDELPRTTTGKVRRIELEDRLEEMR